MEVGNCSLSMSFVVLYPEHKSFLGLTNILPSTQHMHGEYLKCQEVYSLLFCVLYPIPHRQFWNPYLCKHNEHQVKEERGASLSHIPMDVLVSRNVIQGSRGLFELQPKCIMVI